MLVEQLPGWLRPWCLDNLGGEPVEVLFAADQVSTVLGLRLTGGERVVVKAREREDRAVSCVAAQAQLAARGFPCPRPLTEAMPEDALVVHAEEFRPGGVVLGGDSRDAATRAGVTFAWLMTALTTVTVDPPLPNPRWVRWDHTDEGLWPGVGFLDEKDQSVVPAMVTHCAERARRRLLDADLPCVLGYADFEAQNLRWQDDAVWTVHDWDSLAWQPEAALAGAASGSFPRVAGQPPALPPIESSEVFLVAYQRARGRPFSLEEQQVAWAASVWPAAHNGRWEALMDDSVDASRISLNRQAQERLRRAGA